MMEKNHFKEKFPGEGSEFTILIAFLGGLTLLLYYLDCYYYYRYGYECDWYWFFGYYYYYGCY